MKGQWRNFRFLCCAMLGIAVALAACSGAAVTEPTLAGDPENGHELFLNRNVRGVLFTGWQHIPERPGDRVPDLFAAEYLRQSILEPSAFIVEGYENIMAVYTIAQPDDERLKEPATLTENELNDLVAFLLTQ